MNNRWLAQFFSLLTRVEDIWQRTKTKAQKKSCMQKHAAQPVAFLSELIAQRCEDHTMDARASTTRTASLSEASSPLVDKVIEVSENGDKNHERTPPAPATKDTVRPELPKPGSRTRFGSVRVAWHRMTLGIHPDSRSGPPVMLGEEACEERFETVDKFDEVIHSTQKSSSGKKPMYRMSKAVRRDIALQHHSLEEIEQVEKEVSSIRENRKQSSLEPEEGSIKAIIAQNKKSSKQNQAKKKGIFGFLKRRPRS